MSIRPERHLAAPALLLLYTHIHCQLLPRRLQNGINKPPANYRSSDLTVWVPSTTSLKGAISAPQASAARFLKSGSQELSGKQLLCRSIDVS